jgi:hypothetical protein
MNRRLEKDSIGSSVSGFSTPAMNFYRSCVGLGWLAQEMTGFILVWASEE